MDDLEAFAAGHAATLRVTAEDGAPIESATISLNVFALADAAAALHWAAAMIDDLTIRGPYLAGFVAEATPTGTVYLQLARPAIPTDPEGIVTFGSLTELRDAAVRAGLPCPTWTQDNATPCASESGQAGGALLLMFDSRENQVAAIDTIRATTADKVSRGEEPVPMLIGPHWLILAPEVPALAEAFGGGVYAA